MKMPVFHPSLVIKLSNLSVSFSLPCSRLLIFFFFFLPYCLALLSSFSLFSPFFQLAPPPPFSLLLLLRISIYNINIYNIHSPFEDSLSLSRVRMLISSVLYSRLTEPYPGKQRKRECKESEGIAGREREKEAERDWCTQSSINISSRSLISFLQQTNQNSLRERNEGHGPTL